MRKGPNTGCGRRAEDTVCKTARDFVAGLLLFLAVFALASLDSNQAWPNPAQNTQPDDTRPADLASEHPAIGDIRAKRQRSQPAQRSPVMAQGYLPPSVKKRPADVSPSNEEAAPPQTASTSWRFSLIGIMAMVFAAMIALTMHLWRHLRREYESQAGIRIAASARTRHASLERMRKARDGERRVRPVHSAIS